ncbi:MAG: serine hydrolase domain-containing protein [Promethearchaeota archaeon]
METKSLVKIKKLIYKYLRKMNIPGISISVAKDGKIIYHQGFGARNLEKNLPMTPSTIIGIGSCTKSFTALGVMQLVEKGKISLEDNVCTLLDINMPKLTKPIKLKHILSHSSGISALDLGANVFQIQLGKYSKIVPAANKNDFLYLLQNSQEYLKFDPEQHFFYNNDLFVCAGMIIEKYSEMKYTDYIQEKILYPLEMTRSTYKKSEIDNDPEQNTMIGYLPNNDPNQTLKNQEFPYDKYIFASGGLLTSTDQLLNYGMCLLQNGKFNGKQIISPESIKELWTPRISTSYGFGKASQYCFGWVREEDFFGYTIIHHVGGAGVASAYIALIPELNIVVAVAANDGKNLPTIIGQAILTELVGKDCLIDDQTINGLQIIEDVCGTYYSYLDLYKMEIILKGNVLYVDTETDDGILSLPIIMEDPNELKFQIGTFLRNPNKFVQFFRSSITRKIEYIKYDRYLYFKK